MSRTAAEHRRARGAESRARERSAARPRDPGFRGAPPSAPRPPSAFRDRRRFRGSESGQILVLFLLIFTTMVLIASVAVVAGQMLVRRQQAQMVVDAAAFAGASKQAEGLNTIANLNARSLGFLRRIEYSNLGPRIDSEETSWVRFFTGPLSLLFNDWAADTLEGYQGVFDFYNGAITIANCAYAPWLSPRSAAQEIVERNAGPHGILEDDVESQGLLTFGTALVKLTEPEEYPIPPHWYLPYPAGDSPGSISLCAEWPIGTAICVITYGIYISMDGAILIQREIDPIEYKLGRFYDNDRDVRFAYYLKVKQTPTIFGRNFFEELPEIVVAAAAKPYGGYLGNEFEEGGTAGDPFEITYPDPEWDDPGNEGSFSWSPFGFVHGSADGEEIKATYRAKLVPLTAGEVEMLKFLQGDMFGEAAVRYEQVTH